MEQVDEASFGDCAITRLHLNASSATVFTKLLIEDLKVWLEDTTPTDIILPAMPSAGTAALGTDNTDEALDSYCRDYFWQSYAAWIQPMEQ